LRNERKKIEQRMLLEEEQNKLAEERQKLDEEKRLIAKKRNMQLKAERKKLRNERKKIEQHMLLEEEQNKLAEERQKLEEEKRLIAKKRNVPNDNFRIKDPSSSRDETVLSQAMNKLKHWKNNKRKVNQSNSVVIMETSKGNITIKLYDKKAPVTVSNFLSYIEDGFYNNLVFHRVIPNFMIQGGGFDSEMNQKPPKAPIKNEARRGLKNKRGTLAMARTNVINSATGQFFINLINNDFLNHKNNSSAGFGYAVFGEVIDGMDVVDSIGKTRTHAFGTFRDVPTKHIYIKNIRIVK